MKQDVALELFYDAAWNPAPIYERSQLAVKIGRPNAEGGDQPSSVDPIIDNRSAAYHPRNAGSALYGKIGGSSPLRVKVGSAVRWAGEWSGWLPGRSLDGNDSWIEATAGGPTRRLGQGQKPLQAAPYRYATLGDPAVAYWPLDDATLADLGTPAMGDHRMTIRTGAATIKPGVGELGPWLANGVRIDGKGSTPYIEGSVDAPAALNVMLGFVYAGGTGVWSGLLYGFDGQTIWRVRFDEAAGEISVRTRTGGESAAETTQATVSHAAAADRRCHHVALNLANAGGGSVDYTVYVDATPVIGPTTLGIAPTGAIRARISGDTNTANGVSIGHVGVWQGSPSPTAAGEAGLGHQGEPAGTRISRLTLQAGVPFTSTGTLADTVPLGPQHPDELLAILREAAAADGGFMYDRIDAVGLHYRTRRSCENQAAALSLNFGARQVAPPFEPAGDDLPIRNDVTVTRRDGSSARKVLTAGRLSTADPTDTPPGVGIYDEQVTVNVAGDGVMIENAAGWRLHMGTVDEDRFPRVSVDLDRYPALAATVNALRPGDRIDVTGLPAHLSVNPLTLIIEGWTEQLGTHRRVITFNCAPESPYRVGVYQSAAGSTVHKYDSAASTLSAGVTATETSLSVATPTGHPLWTTDDAEDGFDIRVGGERMTVTDISGGASPQTFTVVRSVNGVIKAHSSAAPVSLWQPAVYAL